MVAVTAADAAPLHSIQVPPSHFLVLELAGAFTAISGPCKGDTGKASSEDPKSQMAPNPVLHLRNFNALSVECTSEEGCKEGVCQQSEDKPLFPSHGFRDRRFVTLTTSV